MSDEADIPARVTKRDRSDGTAPKRAYTRRTAAQPQANGENGLSIDAIEAKLRGGGLSRSQRNRLRRMKTQMLLEADNPFVHDRPGNLPDVPWEDDPEHIYHWVRTELPGERTGDRSNLHKKSTGALRYEFVQIDALPEHWRPLLHAFAMPDGSIRYRDVQLARANRRIRDQRLAKMEHEADVLADKVNAEFRDRVRSAGRGLVEPRIDQDIEEMELRDVML